MRPQVMRSSAASLGPQPQVLVSTDELVFLVLAERFQLLIGPIDTRQDSLCMPFTMSGPFIGSRPSRLLGWMMGVLPLQ
jgi:hypothetical protein